MSRTAFKSPSAKSQLPLHLPFSLSHSFSADFPRYPSCCLRVFCFLSVSLFVLMTCFSFTFLSLVSSTTCSPSSHSVQLPFIHPHPLLQSLISLLFCLSVSQHLFLPFCFRPHNCASPFIFRSFLYHTIVTFSSSSQY